MSGSADGPVRPGTRLRRRGGAAFRRPTRAMRRGLSQLVCAIAGLLLGLLAPMVAVGPQVEAGLVVSLLFTIGFGVISLVSIIYSMLFLVVQFSASTFTPRLGLFRDEPIVWRAFAFTVGVFVFCVTSGLTIGVGPGVSAFIPVAAMVLALVAIALMRTLQMKAFDSIQLGHSLSAIATRAHLLFDGLYVRPYDPAGAVGDPPPGPAGATGATGATSVRWSGAAAVLQQFDVPALVGAAREHDCTIAFRVGPGTSLSRGAELAGVSAGGLSEERLRGALVTGVERTFDQDPELAFRLLSDIALRALSSAVNDPATAVDALDRVEDLLTRLAGRELDIGRFHDDAGRLRVTIPVPGWEQFVRTSVDDVVFAAAGSPMALRRMRDLLRGLAERAPESRRGVVRDRLRWVERTGEERYPLVWTAPEGGYGHGGSR
ncbi:DUF2254 family protein [Streptomyces sp. NPDC002044]|uniref:DUF2254 family protein n=1 Tax=Streptomyces sp. NPDC002044 TaxID=3154662 RepID=UPI0033229B21